MPTPIEPQLLVQYLRQSFEAQAPSVRKANNLTGGGGYENWAIVQFIITLPPHDYDYRREFQVQGPVQRMRVDVAFNTTRPGMTTPLILTEWKCNPDPNSLSAGFTQDIVKMTDLLRGVPRRDDGVLPFPLIIGIGPNGAGFPGHVSHTIADTGLQLYISSRDTWRTSGVESQTWYSQSSTMP